MKLTGFRSLAGVAFLSLLNVTTSLAQRGELGLSLGPLLAVTTTEKGIGPGVELGAQYNVSDRSGILLLGQASSLDVVLTNRAGSYGYTNSIISLFTGYRDRFTQSGFYTQLLLGPDWSGGGLSVPRLTFDDLSDWSAVFGVGRRWQLKDRWHVDFGVDYVHGYDRRFQIKGAFVGIVRRPRVAEKAAGQ